MNTRLEQDAADTLAAHEQREQFKVSERARWARAKSAVMTGTWAPTLTELQQKDHERYVVENNLPF